MFSRIRPSADGTLGYVFDRDSNTKTALSQAIMNLLDGDLLVDSSINFNGAQAVMLNFPGDFNIDRVGIKPNATGTFDIYTSDNSTDGIDGDWVKVVDAAAYAAGAYAEYPIVSDNTNIRWIRCFHAAGNTAFYAFHVFGEYSTPKGEFWNAAGTEKLDTVKLPLETPTASNAVDFTANMQFKLKNPDVVEHTYVLEVVAVKYNGDALVTDNYLVKDGAGDPASSISVTVAAGAFSANVLHVVPNIAHEDNPGDGYHDFFLQGTVTA